MLKNTDPPYAIPASVKANLAELHREEYVEVVPNVKLHVRDWGEGNPIVFIHGWPFSDEIFEYQFDRLCQQGFRCIGITMRGFGKSDQPYGEYNYNVFSDDIQKVLGHLKLENATLVGFSMGAAIAIHYMNRHMEAWISRLVLVSAAGPSWISRPGYPYGIDPGEADAMVALCHKNRAELAGNFTKKLFAKEDTASPELVNWLNQLSMQASPYAAAQSLVAMRDSDLREELGRISVPTAIFHGRQDRICPFDMAKQLNKGIKNSHIVEFKNSGHGLFIEEAETFNKELAMFAGEVAGELKIPG